MKDFILIYFSIVFVCGVIMYFNIPDGKWDRKMFDRKIKHIKYACSVLKITEINVENKGFLFRVRVVDEEEVKSISYSNPHTVTDIYINDELVCRLHRLENLFTMHRTPEYASKRNSYEINEIIKKAYKTSKKKLNEHYKTNSYESDLKIKSFYSK